MTVLEQKSVSSEIQFQYQGYYLKLKDFSMESGLGWPLQRDVADLVLADYMDTLFLEKKAAAEGEKTLAALEFFQLELKGTLWHSRRALRGWRKCMPAQSRLPLPKGLMYGMAMLLCHRGHQDMALMTITAFDLYLRPGEALSLVGRNIIAPVAVAGSQFKMVTVVVRDFEDGVPDKVGTYDNSLKLDNPNTAWIGTWLLRRARALNSQESHVFNFKMEDYRKEFVKVGQLLGVENLHPYQLRHGGASQDLSSRFRDHQAVKTRGRWVTDQSVRRYAKTGRVQQLLTKLNPQQLSFCTWSENNIKKVFQGMIPARTLH
jgi:integrase